MAVAKTQPLIMYYVPVGVQYVEREVDWMTCCYLSGICCTGYSDGLAIDLLFGVLAPEYWTEPAKGVSWLHRPEIL
jgi:hypothetical protein